MRVLYNQSHDVKKWYCKTYIGNYQSMKVLQHNYYLADPPLYNFFLEVSKNHLCKFVNIILKQPLIDIVQPIFILLGVIFWNHTDLLSQDSYFRHNWNHRRWKIEKSVSSFHSHTLHLLANRLKVQIPQLSMTPELRRRGSKMQCAGFGWPSTNRGRHFFEL